MPIDELLLGLVVLPSSQLIRKAILYREDQSHLICSMTFWSQSVITYAVLEHNLGMYVRIIKGTTTGGWPHMEDRSGCG